MILKEDVYVRDGYGVRHRKYVKGQTIPQAEYDKYNSTEEVVVIPEPVVEPEIVEEVVPEPEVVEEEVVLEPEDEPVDPEEEVTEKVEKQPAKGKKKS